MSYTICGKMRLLKLVQRTHCLSLTRTLPRKLQELQLSAAANKLTSICGTTNRFSSTTITGSYAEVHRRSVENPEEFWAEAAEKITWFKKWDQVLDNGNQPFTKW